MMVGGTPFVERVVRRFLSRVTPDKVTYTGVFLDAPSHTKLVRWWNSAVGIPLHSTPEADHMTIKFEPTEKEVTTLPLGEKTSLKVVGWASDDKGQAVLVVPHGVVSANAYPHVTMSCAPGTQPVYSNELLSRGFTRVNGPTLTGTIEAR